jgi:hypothetical protein
MTPLIEKKLSPSSILTAVTALRFLYSATLHRDWCLEEMIPAPKKAGFNSSLFQRITPA